MRKLLDLKGNGWTRVLSLTATPDEGGGAYVVWAKHQQNRNGWLNVVVEIQELAVRKRRHYLIYGEHEQRFAMSEEWRRFKEEHEKAAFELMRKMPTGVLAIGD